MHWIRIRSWHAIAHASRSGDWYITRCGRKAPWDAPRSDDLPGDKSCETCLRIVARDA